MILDLAFFPSCIHVSPGVVPRTVCLILSILSSLRLFIFPFSSTWLFIQMHFHLPQLLLLYDENKLINIISGVDKEVFCLTSNLNHITNIIRQIPRTATHFEYTLDHCRHPFPRNTWWINMCAFMRPIHRCVIYLKELLLIKRYYLVSGKIIGLYKYFRIGFEWNLSFVVCHLFTMSCLVKRSPSPHVTLSSGSISQIV